MKNIYRRRAWIIAFMIMLLFIPVTVVASSLELTLPNTSVSGWAYSTQPGHMGTKNTTYSYESADIKGIYENYVLGGIALWGTNISMTYTPTQAAATGLFGVTDGAVDYTATTFVSGVGSNGHRTKYSINISSVNFNSSSNAGRYRTIAHEIGHAYGLGHVANSGQIMYGTYSTTKNVTTQDLWGMKVVTHVHMHSTSTTGTYSEYSHAYHKVVCSSCKGIYLQTHTFSGGVCSKCGFVP